MLQKVLFATQGQRPHWAGVLRWGLLVATAFFYWWTINPEGHEPLFEPHGRGYYNLLARGFLKGVTSLDLPADPHLATVANPYDPAQRGPHGLHDASYFRGKYYLYFGPTPVLLLFGPCYVLTGNFLAEAHAVAIFGLAGVWLGALLLGEIARRYFPRGSPWVHFASVAALCFATMVPALMRRPAFWEVPIACGFALAMLVAYATWKAFHSSRAAQWTCVASVAMGLCLGARPVYLFGAAILLGPAGWAAWKHRGNFRRNKTWWRIFLSATVPLGAAGLCLAAYNVARFGDPFQFGQQYQMAGYDITGMKFFSLDYFWFSARVYLTSAPGLSPFFPFLTVITPPAAPSGHFGIENPYGIFVIAPWTLLAVLSVVAVRLRTPLGWWLAGMWALCLTTAACVFCFGAANNRYMVDFVPALIVLGSIGAWIATGSANRLLRAASAILVAVLCVWSSLAGILISLQHNRLLELNHPRVYEKLAYAANHVSHAADRLLGTTYGPMELRVKFPHGRVGKVEPLVTTGRSFLADYIFVHYLTDRLIRIGFEHTSLKSAVGPALEIDPDVEHVITIQMGSLYPPRHHPYYAAQTDAVGERLRTTLAVTVDGRPALATRSECYDATAQVPDIGTSGDRPAFKEKFSGEILGWRTLSPSSSQSAAAEYGPLVLFVRLPPFTHRRAEPLLCSGERGRGDLIYIVYESENRISIGHDHWGVGVKHSDPVEIVPGAEVTIELSSPPLLGPGAAQRFEAKINGRQAIAVDDHFHPSAPDQVVIGENAIGASTAEPQFTGEIMMNVRAKR
jgi:hypothetical protein